MSGLQTIDTFRLDGVTYVADSQAKLGAGSEGTVVAHPRDPDLCVKLFHPADPGDRDAVDLAAFRARKVRAICGSGLALPPQFKLPMLPAYDPSTRGVIGFQMARVPTSYFKLMKLLDGTFRTDHQMGLRLVAELFADLFDDLAVIHDQGLVVGDVNLGCVMFEPRKGRAWVDTDSWSYGKDFPCRVMTELFAHPDLYVNLQPGGASVRPEPHHDRFAFLVALPLLAIPGAHAFRMGTHPTVRGLQHRAQAGITIFDPDVKVPPALGSLEVLSDDVINVIVERLKRRVTSPFDPELLRAFASEVAGCSKCGTEFHHSRRQCPKCSEIMLVQMPALVSFLFEELFQVAGTLLFAQVIGTDLYLVCRIGSEVRVVRIDEQGAATTLEPGLSYLPGTRYRFFADCLAACPNPAQAAPARLELHRIEGDRLRPLASISTGALEGEGAVFDASSRFLYRTAANALVRMELFGPSGVALDEQVAEVHQRQSWFTADHATGADREVIFGYDRALRNWQWFIIHGNAKGSRYQYHQIGDLGMRAGETVEDFAVYFSASSVLLVMQTLLSGRDYVRYVVVGLDGSVHINQTLSPTDDTFVLWSNLRGKLYQGKSVLHATPDGVVKQPLPSGACVTLADTTGRVTPDDRLIRLNGRVGIVRRDAVLTMTSKK